MTTGASRLTQPRLRRAARAAVTLVIAAAAAGCAAAPGPRAVAAAKAGEAAAGSSAVSGTAARLAGVAGRPQARAAAACDPKAASLAPTGLAAVTPGSFMARIRARGYLIAGVDQSTYHFGYLNPLDGQLEGFDIDMIKAVAQAIFAGPGHIRFKAISDAQRIPDIRDGAVDIVAHTMTITCARLKQVDFSSVYFEAHQRVLVLKNSAAAGLGSLGGQKVCATAGSDSANLISRYPATGPAATPVLVTVPYWTDCLVLLQQGRVAAISTDDSILYGLAAQDPFTKVVGPPLTDEPYGLAISRQHPDFVRFVNAVLAGERAGGGWAASYRHWIGSPVPPQQAVRYAG